MVAGLMLTFAPPVASANIMKDYVGRWDYVETWKGKSAGDKFSLSLIVKSSKSRKGAYISLGYEKIKQKQVLVFREIFNRNKTARLVIYDTQSGKPVTTYTGKWFVRAGRLHYSYASRPDSSGKVTRLEGSARRVDRNNWSGKATYTGGYSIKTTSTRRR